MKMMKAGLVAILGMLAGGVACAGVSLPLGYESLVAVESTGVQYLDTGYEPKAATPFVVELTGCWTGQSQNGGNTHELFGTLGSPNDSKTRYDFGRTYNRSNTVNTWNLATQYSPQNIADTQDHHFTVNYATGVMTVDGDTVLTWSVPSGRKDAASKFYLFARWDNASKVSCQSRFRLQTCRFLQGGAVVRDFVPAKRLLDNKVGLFELVENRFYEPNGTLVGLSYEQNLRLNYLESDGTQYINSEYVPRVATPFSVELEGGWTTDTCGSLTYMLFGVCNTDKNRYDFGRTTTKHTSHRSSWNLATVWSYPNDTADEAEHRFNVNFATGTMAVDGEVVTTWSVPSGRTDAADAFYLFARRTNSNQINCQSPFRMRSCKLIQGDTVQRDFVPSLNPADGAAGLLDLANGRYYAKGGGNDFKWGYAYKPGENGSESIYVGTLTEADVATPRDFDKVGSHAISAAEVMRFPAALTLSEGELSFVDEAARIHEVMGVLTFKGGAELGIDVMASASDQFLAGSVVFDASATVEEPVLVNVSAAEGLAALAAGTKLPFLSVTDQTFTEADAAKFRVKGIRAEIAAEDGVLVLRAVSAGLSEWTGAAGDDKWSTVGNWLDGVVPCNGSAVLFNTAAGGATTMDTQVLSLASIEMGSAAGAFTHGGAQTLAVEGGITNNSAAVQTFSMPMELGSSWEPFVLATAGDLVLTGGVKTVVSPCLVKRGEGMLHINDEAVAQATNVTVEAGVLRLERTGRVLGVSGGGVLTVQSGAQLDIHINNNGQDVSCNEVTHGKAIHIAGSGPAGSKGAIDNSSEIAKWGCNFGKIVLDADATVGGGWMGIRALSGSAFAGAALEGPHTLTVCNEILFNLSSVNVALDRLDVRGVLSFDSAVSGAITNGMHCYSNAVLRFSGVAAGTTFPVTVEESGAVVRSDSGDSSLASALAVKSDVATEFQCDKNLTLSGAVTNEGAVAQTGAGALVLAGRMVGNGAFAGERVRFGGTNNRWEIEVDDEGVTSKIDFDGVTDPQLFTNLKVLAVRTTGSNTEIQTVVLAPAGALTERQAADIVLTVANVQGGVVPNCHLDVADGKLVLTLRDPSFVSTATWMGAGEDASNFSDPANWFCRNDLGQEVERGIPSEHTTLEIVAGSTFSCPAEKSLAYLAVRFASGASLGADCDCSGLDLARVLEGGVLDLAGHDFRMAAQADLASLITITDSTEQGGALRVVVPADTTVQNTAMTLTGTLRFVKAGSGTFSAVKFDQTYTGGTEVEGGTLTLPVSGSSSSTYSAKYRMFGVQGSSITVDAGATFDTKGNYDFYQHPIVLNGGTLANTGCDMAKMRSDGWASMGKVTLLADSFCVTSCRLRFTDGVIDLGGHTLTVNSTATYFHLDGTDTQYSCISNGTMVVNGDGYFNPMGAKFFTRDMRTVDFVLGSPLSINNDMLVRNLTVSCNVNKAVNAGKTHIYGVYTPVSNYMYNFVMKDGATLDLRDKTAAWSANPAPALTKCNTLAFDEGARIRVDLTGRKVRNGDCIVSWNTAKVPANVDTVSFKLIGSLGTLYLAEDGIYLRTGLTLIFK